MFKTNLKKAIHIWGVGVLVVWGGLSDAPIHAQATPNVEVQVVITGIQANDLNEDVMVIDDGEDEMVFLYDLYEVDGNGRVLQRDSATTEVEFKRDDRASGSDFEALRLVVAPTSRVYFVVKAIEVDSSLSDDEASQCGVSNALVVAQCLLLGDCLGLLNPNLLLDCLSDLGIGLTGSNDDLFEEVHLRDVDAIAAAPELVDSNIADRGQNIADYSLEYTIVRDATAEAPVRGDARGYVFIGRLQDGNDNQRWTIDLELGDTATFRMSSYNGDLDTALALLGTNDARIAANDDAPGYDTTNAVLSYDVRVGGTYTIRAERGDGDTSGEYVLEVLIN